VEVRVCERVKVRVCESEGVKTKPNGGLEIFMPCWGLLVMGSGCLLILPPYCLQTSSFWWGYLLWGMDVCRAYPLT